jgi:hypothetical protein
VLDHGGQLFVEQGDHWRWIFCTDALMGCSGHKDAPPAKGSAAPTGSAEAAPPPADAAPPPVIASCENVECEVTLPVPPPPDEKPTGAVSLDITIDTGKAPSQCGFMAQDESGEWHQVVSTDNTFTLTTTAGPNRVQTDCVPCKLAVQGKEGIPVVLPSATAKKSVLTLRCHVK